MVAQQLSTDPSACNEEMRHDLFEWLSARAPGRDSGVLLPGTGPGQFERIDS
jgi:hypothetical protein